MDIHDAEDKKLHDCQQLKPKGSHASFVTTVIAVTILLMLSIFFRRETVNVLVFVFPVVFFQVVMYVVCKRGTCTMLGVGILHYQQVLFQN